MTTMNYTLHLGDCLEVLRGMEAESVQTCVTSPPYYGLRDYGHDGQIGLEPTPDEYVARLVAVFREVRRVLREDGTLWLNLGDSYAGSWGAQGRRDADAGGVHALDCDMDEDCSCGARGLSGTQIVAHPRKQSHTGTIRQPGIKPKDLLGIPWRVAFALQADGWYLRQDIIWHKPNPMPESVRDRCTKAHEYVFLLSKSARYFWDADAVSEAGSGRCPGNREYKYDGLAGHETKAGFLAQSQIPQETRNKRSVWSISSQPYSGAHFAVMPEALVEPCILAGSRRGDIVCDPFTGSGTVGAVAMRLGRSFVGSELNPAYLELARARIEEAIGTGPETTVTKDGERVTQLGLFQ